MSENTSASTAVKRLEEEGEIGADYLEELLDIADLGGDIDIDIDHGRASVAIVASEEGTSVSSPTSWVVMARCSRLSRSSPAWPFRPVPATAPASCWTSMATGPLGVLS